MTSYNAKLGFLYNLKVMKRINDKKLIQKCKDLEKNSNLEENKGIWGNELFTELKIFHNLLFTETATGVLRFMNRIQNPFPIHKIPDIAYHNCHSYKLKQKFSRLELIKTYLRSSMIQEILSDSSESWTFQDHL